MINKNRLITYFSLTFSFFTVYSTNNPVYSLENETAKIQLSVLDSVRQEIVDGERFVIHQLKPKETYYQLSRIYGMPVNDIMWANNRKNLRIGDTVRIPRGKVEITTQQHQMNNAVASSSQGSTNETPQQELMTKYKVSKSETLYAISRRFDISVETIKKVNNLTSDNLREGQILKIPEKNIVETPPSISLADNPLVITDERQSLDLSDFEANKYGIREKKERGIGVWMESLGEGESLALHQTAPIGTILKITNPMNNSVSFAKVVGKFADNEETQNAIVVISKSVAKTIGILDRRFQIELHYGAPL